MTPHTGMRRVASGLGAPPWPCSPDVPGGWQVHLSREASVRASVQRRRVQAEFVARGMRSRDEVERTGEYVEADDVVAALQGRLAAARARVPKTRT